MRRSSRAVDVLLHNQSPITRANIRLAEKRGIKQIERVGYGQDATFPPAI